MRYFYDSVISFFLDLGTTNIRTIASRVNYDSKENEKKQYKTSIYVRLDNVEAIRHSNRTAALGLTLIYDLAYLREVGSAWAFSIYLPADRYLRRLPKVKRKPPSWMRMRFMVSNSLIGYNIIIL